MSKVTSINFWDAGKFVPAGTSFESLSERVKGAVAQAGWLCDEKPAPVVEETADDSEETPDAEPVAEPVAPKPKSKKKPAKVVEETAKVVEETADDSEETPDA